MRVLVTGGAGFIGQHLVRRLGATDAVSEVVCLDVVTQPSQLGLYPGVQVKVGDIRDQRACLDAAERADSIIHLGAVASVPASISHPRSTHEINVTGTLNVLEAARTKKVPHVIVASSSAVYGEHPEGKKHEQLPVQFLSPYAASKGATESYALAYGVSYDIQTLAFRFFNVFGPGQTADHPYAAVIPRFLAAIKQGKSLEIYGDGEQTRDFVSVHTVVDALVEASTRQLASSAPINIASGTSISLNSLVGLLEQIHQTPVAVDYLSERPGDIRHSGASTEALQELIPNLSGRNFRACIAEVYQWYLGGST